MTLDHQNRRALLKTAAAVSAFGTIAGGAPGPATAAGPSADGAAGLRAGIDAVLQKAVDAREVPGVVAMAATDQGIFYEGTFGTRNLAAGFYTGDPVWFCSRMTRGNYVSADEGQARKYELAFLVCLSVVFRGDVRSEDVDLRFSKGNLLTVRLLHPNVTT